MHQRINVTEKSSSDQLKNTDFEKTVEEISKGQKYLVWTVIFIVVLECPVLKLTMSSEKKGGEEKSDTDDQTSRSDSI